ncbi:MAG TPA: LamG domain-containing protein, partial [Spirochaetia bacterium]|nr:LamG domain-containing protein [Spirochaetia bacterium]
MPAASASRAASRAPGGLASLAGTVTRWTLEGDGPGSHSDSWEFDAATVSAAGNTVSLELLVGDWTITIRGFDADGGEAFTATQSVTVARDGENVVQLTLEWAEKALVARFSFDEGIEEDWRGLALTPTPGLEIVTADGTSPNGSPYITLSEAVLHYIDLGAVDLGSSFTVSFWARFTNLQDRALVTSRSAATPDGFTLHLKTNSLQLETPGGVVQMSDAIESTETWYHIAFSIDGGQGTGSIYVNDSLAQTNAAGVGDASLPIRFGASIDAPAALSGSLDTIYIYSGTLDQEEVARLYRRGFYAGGSGTAADPYLVANATQLKNVERYPAANYKQIENIDLNADPFSPIASFSGQFDGSGRSISKLRITSETSQTGLFKLIHDSGTVRNLTIDDVQVTAYGSTGTLAGAIVSGSVYNVSIKNATISSPTAINIGGLAGKIETSTISGIRLEAMTIEGGYLIGSLTGEAIGSDISDVQSTVAATTSNVASSGAITGLLIGRISSNTVVSRSSASGTLAIKNNTNVLGGFIGHITSGQVSDCSSAVTLTHEAGSTTVSSVGEFAGVINYTSGFPATTVTNCRVLDGEIAHTGGTRIGGFA